MKQENRPWLKNYPAGWVANINPDEYCSLVEVFEDTFAKFGEKPAFSNMGKEISYKTLDKLSRDFGAYLFSRGLKKGDKIALMMPNLLQFPIALIGALRAGLVVVNTNPQYTAREMKHQFTDSECKAIIISENYAFNLEKIIGDTNIDTVIVTSLGELLGTLKGGVTNFVVRNIKRLVPKYNIDNAVNFKTALKEGKKFKLPIFEALPEDVVIHQYTGGTTGVAKGAMLTNRNLISVMLEIKGMVQTYISEPNLVALSPLPLYHVFAFAVNGLALMSMGVLNVIITNPRDLKSVTKEFKKYDISLMTGVNTLFNALLNMKDFGGLNFNKLKITIGGGTAVQTSVSKKWEEVTGCYLAEGYGLSETCALVSCNPYTAAEGQRGTIGMPAPSTDVRIINDNGEILGFNEPGELIVKGPQVMKGYYNKPKETAESIKDGWFATGDVAIMKEDGFLKIVDRKKDMILVSGFNVFPNEIEDVVSAHPKVDEAAVIGVPNEKTGESVKLFVVKKDKSLSKEELTEYCRENLTNYKVPKIIEFKKELPKSTVGKILRRALRDT